MPQISKIRIVNVYYNDGKRFIPDELYNLSSESGEALNSLFNLNNGGGKTVLVQLLMQPVNPRAMAGGRHIEDYFVRSSDHSFVLIEWNTDGSKEKLLTGIAIAASQSNTSEEDKRGNSVRYYTFMTVYENYSKYSIESLDLSKNENGRFVPASYEFVKELAKSKTSNGAIQCYGSDDKAKWANKLAEYGIYKNEWETVIETLNKDEGGLNQYFDDAKTSDKLISKFFIPAIEHKMKSVVTYGGDSSLETMLINYARKISEKELIIKERDTNKSLLGSLSVLDDMSEQLYNVNDSLTDIIGEACGYRGALSRRISYLEREVANAQESIEGMESQIRHIIHEEKSKDYYDAYEEKIIADEEKVQAQKELDSCKVELSKIKHEEEVIHCAKLFSQYKENNEAISAIKSQIEERENDSNEAEHISRLKFSTLIKSKEKIEVLQSELDNKNNTLHEMTDDLSEKENEKRNVNRAYEDAKNVYNNVNAEYKVLKRDNDNRVRKLGIDVQRRFDETYAEDVLQDEKIKKEKIKSEIKSIIETTQRELSTDETRKAQIPELKSEVKVSLANMNHEKETLERELSEYDDLFDKVTMICNKYSIDSMAIFSGNLRTVVSQEYDVAVAQKEKIIEERKHLDEKLQAVNDGYLHISPKIMEYVASTGISCQTGEGYLCSQMDNGNYSKEQIENILKNYPEIAFSLIFINDNDVNKLLAAGNTNWLPAAVPLFTMGQLQSVLDGTMTKSAYLAAWDREFFSDKNSYSYKIKLMIEEKNTQIDRYDSQIQEYEKEKKLIEKFAFSEDWRENKVNELSILEEKLVELNQSIRKYDEELTKLNRNIDSRKDMLDKFRKEQDAVDRWIDQFSELSIMLGEENKQYQKTQNAYNQCKEAERKLAIVCKEYDLLHNAIEDISIDIDSVSSSLNQVERIMQQVSNAKITDVIEGELDSLYAQYCTMCENMNSSLEDLRNSIKSKQETMEQLLEEIKYYNCNKEEYEVTSFSTERMQAVKETVKLLEAKRESCQERSTKCETELKIASLALENANKALEEYGGEALTKNEIGSDFKKRIKVVQIEIKNQKSRKENLDRENRNLDKIKWRVDNVLAEYKDFDKIKAIELTDVPDKQWDIINNNLNRLKKDYSQKKEQFQMQIYKTKKDYSDIAISEIVNKLSDIDSMIEKSDIKGDRLYTVSESISAMIDTIEKINSKIDTDLQEIENDFNDIVNQCTNQGKRIYQDLRMIANSSKAHLFEGKPQTQMVKMDLPEEKEISEEASRVAIKNEIEYAANEIKELMKENRTDKDIQKKAKASVGSERLLHKYIGRDSIQVRVYKIDMNKENSSYKRWEDTLTQNSGAEKFVVFFAVVVTLMNYTRSSSGLVNKKDKSVLILDNPFGKITSSHLLKPMFDIAKHFNVQLICLSDINKSDVINCFECVIKLVIRTQSLSNFELMTHEGNEKIEHGYYKIMNGQLRLF